MTKPASTIDENDTLYHRIKDGDTTAVAEMIERNMPLVKSRVGVFITSFRRFKHLHEDLVSEGYMALVKTVNKFGDSETKKPTGRLVFDIDKALGDYIDSEIGAGMMADRTVRSRRSKNKSLPEQLPYNTNNLPANLWTRADGRVIRKQIVDEQSGWAASVERGGSTDDRLANIDHEAQIGTTDSKEMIACFTQPDTTPQDDLLDTILACCECDEEEMIVNLRLKGYTDAEIGEQLSVSQHTIWTRRKAIEERFNKRMAQ